MSSMSSGRNNAFMNAVGGPLSLGGQHTLMDSDTYRQLLMQRQMMGQLAGAQCATPAGYPQQSEGGADNPVLLLLL